MIKYFWESLWPSIQAQLDVWNRYLDSWDKIVDKIVNVEAKTSFQAFFGTKNIDSKCLWCQWPIKKEDEDFRDFEKNNFF